MILGETDKDIIFGITVYMSKPEGIEDLVNNLFDIALIGEQDILRYC